MNKNEIITLIVIGITILLLSGFGAYAITTNSNHTDSEPTETSKVDTQSSDTLKVGNYTLHYGNYVGISSEYDNDTEKSVDTETVIILQKDKIVIGGTSNKYEIDNSRLKVNGTSIINVTGNDQFTLEAGAGIDYKYQEN